MDNTNKELLNRIANGGDIMSKDIKYREEDDAIMTLQNGINRIKRIEKHFENITVEEFEQNLTKCGIDVIEPSIKSGFKLK